MVWYMQIFTTFLFFPANHKIQFCIKDSANSEVKMSYMCLW